MTNTNAPAAVRQLAQLPEGGTAELEPLGAAVDGLAAAWRCISGEAAEALASAIESQRVDVYLLRGPNTYASPAPEGYVWQRSAMPSTAAPSGTRRGFQLSGGAFSSMAWADPAPLVVVRRGAPPAAPAAELARADLVGTAGLCTLLRAAAGMARPGAALASVPAAIRLDMLARIADGSGGAAHRGAMSEDLATQGLADVDRWGAKYTDESPPRALVRLADEVRWRTSPQRPVRLAAADVLEIVERMPPSGGWFILQRGRRARAATSADIWRPPSRFGESEGWSLGDGGNPFAALGGGMPGEVEGVQGLLACLKDCWTEKAVDTAGLDDGPAGAVAILEADALRMFRVRQEEAATAPAYAEGLASALCGSQPRPGVMKPGRPADEVLRTEWKALTAAGVRNATATLAARYGLSPDTIQRATKSVRPAASTKRPASSVFDLARRAGKHVR